MDRSFVEVWEAFELALGTLGLRASFQLESPGAVRWDAVGLIEGVPVVVEMKMVPQVGDVLALESVDADGAYKMLVGRRISATVREALSERDMGFFDSRGHVRLWRHPFLVDTGAPALVPVAGSGGQLRFETASLLDVALAVMDRFAVGDGSAVLGVRETAAMLGRSPGTVSKQLAMLRAAYLIDDRGAPTVPNLFEAVVEEWHPVRIPLAGRPRPNQRLINQRLEIGFDDPKTTGWVLADSFAAAAWGAPVVLSGDAPPDFYVPDSRALRQARTLLGDADFGRHACTVAVAPAPFVCRHRCERSKVFNNEFFAPSPVVAALDLAIDPARGREILQMWSQVNQTEVRPVW